MGMFDYVFERNGKVELAAIDKPEIKGSTPLEIFEQVLEHEEFVTSRINALMDVAEEVKDRAALSFLDWYLKEQVEEESNVGGVLANLRLIGDDKKALFMLIKTVLTNQRKFLTLFPIGQNYSRNLFLDIYPSLKSHPEES